MTTKPKVSPIALGLRIQELAKRIQDQVAHWDVLAVKLNGLSNEPSAVSKRIKGRIADLNEILGMLPDASEMLIDLCRENIELRVELKKLERDAGRAHDMAKEIREILERHA